MAEPTNVILAGNGKIIGQVTGNPTESPGVTYNSNPLPAGSVVRNTVDGQKFIAGGASATDFVAIPITPKVGWTWLTGSSAWEVLQNK